MFIPASLMIAETPREATDTVLSVKVRNKAWAPQMGGGLLSAKEK